MVVDSSVTVATLRKGPGWERLREALLNADCCMISAATLVEAGSVMEGRLGRGGAPDLDRLVAEVQIEIVSFDARQAEVARQAFRRLGNGRHAARLNFGDCLSYALARHLAAPLLFVGAGFARTDIEAALPPA